MTKIEIRAQKVSDAKRFFEILNNGDFVYFPAKPESLEAEKECLRKNRAWRKDNFKHNYAILYRGNVVGGIGAMINQHHTDIGEIGYFVDRNFWGKGIAPQAVKLIESECFGKLNLHRIEVVIDKKNKASIRVAEKAGYKKEGIQRGNILNNGKYNDAYLFAKLNGE
jgi:RimJ/RimL family protein N-acetyltransferase